MTKILIVAEQPNVKSYRANSYSPEEWHRYAMTLGAFRGKSRGRARLEELVGPYMAEAPSMNICPPGDVFDTHLADQVAAIVRDDDTAKWDRIVLCGRRVASCFGIDWNCYWGSLLSGRYVILPHPSGRNRWWNRGQDDLEYLMTRELAIRSLVSDEYVTGLCRVCTQPLIELDTEGLCPAHEALV